MMNSLSYQNQEMISQQPLYVRLSENLPIWDMMSSDKKISINSYEHYEQEVVEEVSGRNDLSIRIMHESGKNKYEILV